MQYSRKDVIGYTVRKRNARRNIHPAMEMRADPAEWRHPVRTGFISHILQKW